MERDLTLGIKTTGGPEAQAAVGELRDAVTGLTIAEGELAVAAQESADTVTGNATKELEARVALDEALHAAIVAMGEYAAAAAESSKAGEAGFQAAAIAVAGLEEAIAAAGGATAETTVLLQNYVATLNAASAASDQLAIATEAEAATEIEDAAATEAATAAKIAATQATRQLGTEATLARGNIGGLARALASMGGPVAEFVLPVMIGMAALKLLPQMFKLIEDGGTSLGNMYNKLTGAVVEHTKAQTAANAALVKTDQAEKSAADTTDLLARANLALSAGLIAAADSAKLFAAEEQSREDAMHRTEVMSKSVGEALKESGYVITKSFLDITSGMVTFANEYQRRLEVEGPASALRFATANKKAMDQAIQDAQDAGIMIPAAFTAISDSMGLMGKTYDDNVKAIDKLNKKIDEEDATLRAHITQLAVVERAQYLATQAKINASNLAFKVVTDNFNLEYTALDNANKRGEMSNAEYRQKLNDLQGQEIDDRRKHEAAIQLIQDQADIKQAEENLKAAIAQKKLEDEAIANVKSVNLLVEANVHLAEVKAANAIKDADDEATAHGRDMATLKITEDAHIASYNAMRDASVAATDAVVARIEKLTFAIGLSSGAVRTLVNEFEQLRGATGGAPPSSPPAPGGGS